MKLLAYCLMTLMNVAPRAFAASGDLIFLTKLGTSSAYQLQKQANDPSVIPLELAGIRLTHPVPKNDVTFYKVTYETTDVGGQPTVATGLLIVPDSGAPAYPLIAFHHATETDRADVPSSFPRNGGDSTILAIEFASQGYLVAAPDYIGLGDSPGFHPYFHKDTLLSASVDMLRATKEALRKLGTVTNGQLFLTGYSEGGYTTMLLAHFLEKSHEFSFTAAAPMAGPYDLQYSVKKVIVHPSLVNPAITSAELAYLLSAYNNIYGGIFKDPQQIFRDKFSGPFASAFDGLHSPQDLLQIFSENSQPLGPQQALQPWFITDVLNNPKDRFAKLLGKNKGYGWTDWQPQAPITLYQGMADTEVPVHNSELALAWLKSAGAQANFVNLGDNVDHGSGPLIAYPLALQWFESFRH